MPMQPPRFGRPAAPAKAWQAPGRNTSRRLRGRAGVADRKKILAEEPLCRPCMKAGRVRASEQVDHIDPNLPGDLWDARSNKQGICKPCHKAKSIAEAAERRRRRGLT